MSQYLFIDGAYLRSNFERQMQEFYGQVPRLNFLKLAAFFGTLERAYYYDAIDHEQPDHVVEQKVQLHDYINSLPGFHVRDGRVRRSPSKKKREQEGVDVQLAVDALEHAARGNMTLASVLTGDLDFEPLPESVVRMGIRTKLIYVPSTTSRELMRAADEIQKITLEHFFMWSAPSFMGGSPRHSGAWFAGHTRCEGWGDRRTIRPGAPTQWRRFWTTYRAERSP